MRSSARGSEARGTRALHGVYRIRAVCQGAGAQPFSAAMAATNRSPDDASTRTISRANSRYPAAAAAAASPPPLPDDAGVVEVRTIFSLSGSLREIVNVGEGMGSASPLAVTAVPTAKYSM